MKNVFQICDSIWHFGSCGVKSRKFSFEHFFLNFLSIFHIVPDEVMQAVRNHDPSGRAQYDKICERMGIVPVSYFMRHILDTEITMRWHGLGPGPAKAIALVLRVGVGCI